MRIRNAAALLGAVLLVAGCSNSASNPVTGVGPTDPTSGNGAPPATPGVGSFKALFNPSLGILPYPTDLYFNGSTDGTLVMPNLGALTPNVASLNELDGFSTTASTVFRMSQAVKNDPVMLASSIRIIEMVTLRQSNGVYAPVASSPLRGPNPVLIPGTDYNARLSPDVDTLGSVIEIQWLKPLNASAGVFCPAPLPTQAICGIGYVVLVTEGIQNTSGTAATPDRDYLTVRTEAIAELGRAEGNPAFLPTCPGITNPTLNGICRLTFAHLAVGDQLPPPARVNPASVVLSYSFTTQSTRDVLVYLSQTQAPQPMTAVPTRFTTADLVAGLPGIADVYTGSLQIPYYLSPPSQSDPTAPLTKRWTAAGPSTVPGIAEDSRAITRFNLVPGKVADLKIPVLIFKPNGNSPSGGVKPDEGWPVVVFMHGITRSRQDVTAIADTYASQGFVVVTIDQVLHGITDKTNPLYAGPDNPLAAVLYGPDVRERTFDVDYINNGTGAPGPDGVIDPSGQHVINLTAPLVTRDGLRQTGSDMITLVKSLAAGNLNLDLVEGGDIDSDRIHYAGISLGGIVGPACICTEMKSYYLNVPGAPLPEILRTSPSFAPAINAGLAAASGGLVVPGTSAYSQFFRDLMMLWDGGDPANYVKRLSQDRPVLFTKVIGDTVVPNGTNDYLIRAAGATKVSTAGPQPIAAGSPKFVTFLSGSHGSLFNPADGLAVTQEMQTHAASLVARGGAAFQVVNADLLEQ
jgi:hypothetical protein